MMIRSFFGGTILMKKSGLSTENTVFPSCFMLHACSCPMCYFEWCFNFWKKKKLSNFPHTKQAPVLIHLLRTQCNWFWWINLLFPWEGLHWIMTFEWRIWNSSLVEMNNNNQKREWTSKWKREKGIIFRYKIRNIKTISSYKIKM